MTTLEVADLIFTYLTLIGLIAIAAGVVRRQRRGKDFPLYPALGFTAIVGALWIIVELLKS